MDYTFFSTLFLGLTQQQYEGQDNLYTILNVLHIAMGITLPISVREKGPIEPALHMSCMVVVVFFNYNL